MAKALAAVGVLLAATVAVVADPLARAEPAASRIIDRTVVCAIGKRAGVRKVEVHARTGTRLFGDPTKWKFLASASARDSSGLPYLGVVAAGWPPELEPGQTSTNEVLAVAARCKHVSTRVPLTTKGLSGFAASPLDDEYHCVVPRRVLVRIKATFRAPTTLRLNRRWHQLTARGVVREGIVAVSTESGKAVSVATVNENGKARLYVADHCEPDLISSDG